MKKPRRRHDPARGYVEEDCVPGKPGAGQMIRDALHMRGVVPKQAELFELERRLGARAVGEDRAPPLKLDRDTRSRIIYALRFLDSLLSAERAAMNPTRGRKPAQGTLGTRYLANVARALKERYKIGIADARFGAALGDHDDEGRIERGVSRIGNGKKDELPRLELEDDDLAPFVAFLRKHNRLGKRRAGQK